MVSRRLRILAASTLAIFGLFGVSLGVVSAHAQFAGSTPSPNATVSAAPATIQVTFTQEISDIQIKITGPDGSEVTTAPAKFDLAQRHIASVPTRDAGPGMYTVVWHNVSGEDGDSNDGSFVFTVAGAAAPNAPTTPAAQPTTSDQPSTTTQTTTAPSPTCVDNGVKTPGIADVRVDTYCKRQAIRDKYAGQIDVSSFNDDLAAGKGFQSALADAMADYLAKQAAAQKKH